MKRMFDVLLSGLGILILCPFLLPMVCLLKFSGEREVFYVQKRVGINGNLFGLLKFATMLKDSPNIGSGEITVKNDPRVSSEKKLLDF